MASVSPHAGTRYQLNNNAYEIKRKWQKGNFEIVNLATGEISTINESEIKKEFYARNLRFEVMGKNTRGDPRVGIKTEYSWMDFTQIDDRYRNIAWERFLIVKELVALPDGASTRAKVGEIAESVTKRLVGEDGIQRKIPAVSTVYDWRKDFLASGDIRSLVPRHENKGGKGKPRLPEPVNKIIEAAIHTVYLTEERPSVQATKEAADRLVDEENKQLDPEEKFKPLPYSTINFRIKWLDPSESTAARYGQKAADSYYGDVHLNEFKATRPFQRLMIDHSPCDLAVVDFEDRLPIGRPTFTFSVDELTTMPGGIYAGFEPPSYLTDMQCLLHTIMPKDYIPQLYPAVEHTWDAFGVPEEVVVDLGADFQGKHLNFACAQLGVSLFDCPVKAPWFKGSMERHFRTLNQELLHRMPGTTFSNLFDKKDYDPTKNAVISLEALLESLHLFAVDYYPYRINRGIQGMPAKKWEEAAKIYSPAYPPSLEELQILLSCSEERVIGKQGIEYEGLFYNDFNCLAVLRRSLDAPGRKKEKVLIKINPADISYIYVHDPIRETYVYIPAVNQGYAKGLSIWKHRVVRQVARNEYKEVDEFALARAKAKIQDIVDREWTTTKKMRKHLARQKGIGKTSPWLEGAEPPEEVAATTFSAVQDGSYNDVSDFYSRGSSANKLENDVEVRGAEQGGIVNSAGKGGKKKRKEPASNPLQPQDANMEKSEESFDLSCYEITHDRK